MRPPNSPAARDADISAGISNELARKTGYNVQSLADELKKSPRQLERLFKSSLALTPKAWLNNRRLELAKEMLERGDRIKLVYKELGFADVSHFTRLFKKVYLSTPSQYARKVKRGEHSQ
jgi:AraC-like DNA-binding protein